MYAITTTPGFIIESRPTGEAGKLLAIFTRDLGLVWATAQGIRLEKSKLRYHTQEYARGTFSFVRGKEFWKLTSAGERNSKYEILNTKSIKKKNEAQELIGRIALLLRRLLHGEEAHPELFDHIEKAIDFITACISEVDLSVRATESAEFWATLESLIVFRILYLLGYIGNDVILGLRPMTEPFSMAYIAEMMSLRTDLNKHINKALRESHL